MPYPPGKTIDPELPDGFLEMGGTVEVRVEIDSPADVFYMNLWEQNKVGDMPLKDIGYTGKFVVRERQLARVPYIFGGCYHARISLEILSIYAGKK